MKKGFTLIELLAVILILGIIALIAIPQVTNIIDESNRGAIIRSAESYVKEIETQITISEINGEKVANGTHDLDDITVDIKGKVPETGTVTIYNGEVMDAYFSYDDCEVIYDGEDYIINPSGTHNRNNVITFTLLNGETLSCTLKGVGNIDPIYFDPVTGMKCSEADYQNNLTQNNITESQDGLKTGCMRWYQLSEEGSFVNLILDHNTTKNVVWNSSGVTTSGPNEVLTTLRNDTSSWSSSLSRTDSYVNNTANYTINYTGMKARLPRGEEIAWAAGRSKKTWNDELAASIVLEDFYNNLDISTYEEYVTYQETDFGMYTFDICNYYFMYQIALTSQEIMMDYANRYYLSYAWLYNSNVNKELGLLASGSHDGYWTSSPSTDTSSYGVCSEGGLHLQPVNSNDFGVRPVITIAKDILK